MGALSLFFDDVIVNGGRGLYSWGMAETITINSLADVNRLHAQEVHARRISREEMVRNALNITSNLGAGDMLRTAFMKFLLDGPRDIDAECGYPSWLTPDHYRAMYDREGVAKRVVHCEPEETWKMDPEIFEDEDPENETEFEKAWIALEEELNLYHYLERIDALSGIGQFGILLIGLDDGLGLEQPVDGLDELGKATCQNEYKIIYLRPFTEEVVFVKIREIDPASPRYGQPVLYTVQFRDYPNWGIQAGEIIARDIHWTRVIHVADNRKMSEVFGVPRMQQVWNRLYDLRKTYSSSGEAFWKGGFPGMAFEINPELADQGVELDKDSIRKEFENYQNGLQRYLAVQGVTTKTLPPMVVDPNPHLEAHLKCIAISKSIPYRILFGSEEAKLAGGQDKDAWNGRLRKRQLRYVTPMIIRPFVDRLIAYGVLPEPEKYSVDWPDLDTPSDQDKAGVALTETQALQAYVSGGVDQMLPPDVFLVHILKKTVKEKDAMLAGMGMDAGELGTMTPEEDGVPDDGPQEEQDANEGGLANLQDDRGDVMAEGNLSGRTTVRGKPVGAVFPGSPSLNSLVHNDWSDAARAAALLERQAHAKGKAPAERPGFMHTIRNADLKHTHPNPDTAARVEGMKIPPGWAHVQVSQDTHSPLQVVGVDSKGKQQYRYSTEHSDTQAASKFVRVKNMMEQLPAIREKISGHLGGKEHGEEAAVLNLIDKTGLRVGSDKETGAKKQAYGASTLLSRHVTADGGKTTLNFVGKKGVDISHQISDAGVAKDVAKRSKVEGRLFNTSDSRVRDYLHGIAPGFKVKDFRTAVAADTASKVMKTVKTPTNAKELESAMKEVGKQVAAKLGNTPAVALKSYIPPEVFAPWHASSKGSKTQRAA